jgi:hypothetical protein
MHFGSEVCSLRDLTTRASNLLSAVC